MRKIIILILCEAGLITAAVTAYNATEIAPAWVWPVVTVICFAAAIVVYYPEIRQFMGTRHTRDSRIADDGQSKTEPIEEQHPMHEKEEDPQPDVSQMPPVPTKQSSSIQLQDGRPYTLRTVEEILKEYDGRTMMQGDRIVRQYLGKWMNVDGVIDDALEADSHILVYLGKPMVDSIMMEFDKELWEDQLETLTKGDRIKGKGRISEIQPHRVILTDCVLNIIGRQ